MSLSSRAIRCQILSCTAKPQGEDGWFYHRDGLIWVEEGMIKVVGDFSDVKHQLPQTTPIEYYPEQLLVPGFIDMHVHYPQLEMIASYGEQLLDWLNRYTFPVEQKYQDFHYASQHAMRFLNQLISHGTTSALVFATSAKQSVDAFFEQAHALNMRMVSGKVLMDRHAPSGLCDSAQEAYDDSTALIEQWRGLGRLGYAVTPRFAPTSSPEQLEVAGSLLQEHPDTFLHTHLSENRTEIAWVAELFPTRLHYLDVYDHYGLVTDRSVFAHGIHLSELELDRLHHCGSTICHCPSSNLFLGSGLYPLQHINAQGVRSVLGTDVGGGTSLSMLSTMGDAYKVQQLAQHRLDPLQAFYMATLAGAEALHMEDKVGSLQVGLEADMVRLNLASTPIMAERMKHAKSIEDILFTLMILADDRAVEQTYIMGRPMKENPTAS